MSDSELFDEMVNSFQKFLTFVTERSVLNDVVILDLPEYTVIHAAIGQGSQLILD